MTTDTSPQLLIFIERVYFPALSEKLGLAPITIDGYKDKFKYVQERLGNLTLDSTKPVDIRDLLERIVAEDGIGKTSNRTCQTFP